MDKTTKGIITFVFALMIASVGWVTFMATGSVKKDMERGKQYTASQTELDGIFGQYNDNYTDKVGDGKDARVLMLEANNSHTKKANEAIVNYLTNVGGKLVSINEKKFTEKESSTRAIPVIIGNVIVPILNRKSEEVDKSKNTYVIMIPKDAQFADELQEKLDLYVEFSK